MKLSELRRYDHEADKQICRCNHHADFHDLDGEFPGLAPCQKCECRCYKRQYIRLAWSSQ